MRSKAWMIGPVLLAAVMMVMLVACGPQAEAGTKVSSYCDGSDKVFFYVGTKKATMFVLPDHKECVKS